MNDTVQSSDSGKKPARLSKADRRRQLLDTALLIVKEEGADELTLGNLAKRATISKPVVYDHFPTRSALLIDLYRWIDTERVEAFRKAMSVGHRDVNETVEVLANVHIKCASETDGEFQAVGAALAGSAEKAAVFEELLDNCVQMFMSVLSPYTSLERAELERRCIGLVGAAEALAGAILRGSCTEAEGIASFIVAVHGSLLADPRGRAR